MFLAYIVVGILSAALFARASAGADPAARLQTLASHLILARTAILLGLSTSFIALTLAVATYALTRTVDPHLALLAVLARGVEGTLAAVSTVASLLLVHLAGGGLSLEPRVGEAAGILLLDNTGWFTVSATAFAVGSLLFTHLLLRGRIIPVPLARLGLWASVLLVLVLPAGILTSLPAWLAIGVWLPMLLFEVPCGVWLLTKGAREPALATSGAGVA